MSRFLIYALRDVDGNLRYVGQSTSGLKRPRWHFSPAALRRRDYCHSWMKSELAAGRRPTIEVLSDVHVAEALNAMERFWISHLRAAGCRLTNLTDGGDGQWGRVMSPETRAKISASKRGKMNSRETMERCWAANRGRKATPESVEKRVSKRRGQKISEEHRKKLESHWANRKPDTPEAKARKSQAIKAWWAKRKASQ